MKVTPRIIPYLAIAGLLVYVFILRSCEGTEDRTTVDVEQTSDTNVDSLISRIKYLEALPPDTIKADTIYIDSTSTEIDEDGTEINTVHSSYSDSLITARWSLAIAGKLIDQDFRYIPRATPVVRETVTKYVTTTNTVTKTITHYKTRSYLSAGLLVGAGADNLILAPQLGYTVSNGTQLTLGYDVLNETPIVGVNVKVSLRKLLSF